VPGAYAGKGLGNQFLDEIRKADALIHIVDAAGATDSEGRLCAPGAHDPLEDVAFLENEITMWLFQILKKDWLKISRTVEATKEGVVSQLEGKVSGLSIRRAQIVEAIRTLDLNTDKPTTWSDENLKDFADTLRRISKPMLIVANKIDLPHAEENLQRLKQSGYIVVPCCSEAELAMRRAAERGLIDYRPGDSNFRVLQREKMSPQQRAALERIREKILLKWGSSGVQEAVNASFFRLLHAVTIYPVEDVEKLANHKGMVLPDVFLVPYGTTAKQMAGLIHTDLGEGFLYAIDVRTKRRLGDDHILKDRDVISIVSTKRRG